jgi:hypothetical protein
MLLEMESKAEFTGFIADGCVSIAASIVLALSFDSCSVLLEIFLRRELMIEERSIKYHYLNLNHLLNI